MAEAQIQSLAKELPCAEGVAIERKKKKKKKQKTYSMLGRKKCHEKKIKQG